VTRRTTLRRIVTAARVLAPLILVMALLAWFVYRPWALTWGATPDEVSRSLPGDSIVPQLDFDATRAVTIDAPPQGVWPWIVQMGYGRAGFYSYDRLDNDGIPSSEIILPKYQHLEVGDLIPLSASAQARVAAMDPPRSMVWVFEMEGDWSGATWVWQLDPVGSSGTRLVSRLRAGPLKLRSRVLLDLGEIIMMRKCMLGIKRRAEAARGFADVSGEGKVR
jgi:hypothetical protein